MALEPRRLTNGWNISRSALDAFRRACDYFLDLIQARPFLGLLHWDLRAPCCLTRAGFAGRVDKDSHVDAVSLNE
jgi:hypothetical protein